MKNSTYTKKKSNSESGLLRNPMILPFETKKEEEKTAKKKNYYLPNNKKNMCLYVICLN